MNTGGATGNANPTPDCAVVWKGPAETSLPDKELRVD